VAMTVCLSALVCRQFQPITCFVLLGTSHHWIPGIRAAYLSTDGWWLMYVDCGLSLHGKSTFWPFLIRGWRIFSETSLVVGSCRLAHPGDTLILFSAVSGSMIVMCRSGVLHGSSYFSRE